jgi:hypothetical protein
VIDLKRKMLKSLLKTVSESPGSIRAKSAKHLTTRFSHVSHDAGKLENVQNYLIVMSQQNICHRHHHYNHHPFQHEAY